MSCIVSLLPASHVAARRAGRATSRRCSSRPPRLLEGKTGIKRSQILDSLLARERLGSTGLGQGIAIPHGRVKGLREAVGAFVRTRAPIPFDAPDDAAGAA